MYSTYNEGKSERVIRTLKDKVFKHITAVLKNIYFDMLDDFLNKWNNTVHRTIKMKPIDVISDSYAEYNENSNEKYLKCKTGDQIMLGFQNTKTFLLKDIPKIGQKKLLLLVKLKTQFRGPMLLVTRILKQFLECFMKKNCKKKIKKNSEQKR